MQFQLLDEIVSFVPGKELRGRKRLTLAEEYLADHFPGFPIMPGVLQLHCLIEAGSWLLRLTDDFRYSVIALREVKIVKYGALMQPGKTLDVAVELSSRSDATAVLQGVGETGGVQTVNAKFTLHCRNLVERDLAFAGRDAQLVKHLRDVYVLLSGAMRPAASVGH
jgi:3-hydroxyacyl-[acyl-carrier-protein] dehydratase